MSFKARPKIKDYFWAATDPGYEYVSIFIGDQKPYLETRGEDDEEGPYETYTQDCRPCLYNEEELYDKIADLLRPHMPEGKPCKIRLCVEPCDE